MLGKSLSEKTLSKTNGNGFKILVEVAGIKRKNLNLDAVLGRYRYAPSNAHETPLQILVADKTEVKE